MINVVIGIQARSGSKRLPGKSLELIDDVTMTEHVLNAAAEAVNHINRTKIVDNISASYCLLIPQGDPIREKLAGACPIYEGPEDDVLGRYKIMADFLMPDYIVRLTGDCPLIIPPIITKHVAAAVKLNLDYCSNAFEDLRTFVDGYDCEIISAKAFDYLVDRAKDPKDREHVTTYLRRVKPRWARFGAILGHIDLSEVKLSVDTLDDLNAVRAKKKSLTQKLDKAKELGYAVVRF